MYVKMPEYGLEWFPYRLMKDKILYIYSLFHKIMQVKKLDRTCKVGELISSESWCSSETDI